VTTRTRLTGLTASLALAAVTAAAPTPPAEADVSWVKTMGTSFNTSAKAGTVGQVYRDKMVIYDDGPQYRAANLSVHDGKLDVRLTGKTGAAFFFKPTPTTVGQTYAKVTVKFKVVGGDNYGAAFMLWPNEKPGESSLQAASRVEIDFPEGRFDKGRLIYGFHHRGPCSNADECHKHERIDTGKSFLNTVHTAQTIWSNGGVRYVLDGRQVGYVAKWKPAGDHRVTVQTAPQDAHASAGHLYLYSITTEKVTP
jgi:hypothetical protein